jgi:hypothetical protein
MPRCKNCKEKFVPAHFNQKYCFKEECVKVWCKVADEKRWKEKVRVFKKQTEMKSLPKLAKYHFHQYIRLRDKDAGCISCGKPLIGKYDAGHFWNSNNHAYVRFNEDNVHAQCVTCNQHLHGNLLEYQKRLRIKIGNDRYDHLELIRHKDVQWTAEHYNGIIKSYKQKVKKMHQGLQE